MEQHKKRFLQSLSLPRSEPCASLQNPLNFGRHAALLRLLHLVLVLQLRHVELLPSQPRHLVVVAEGGGQVVGVLVLRVEPEVEVAKGAGRLEVSLLLLGGSTEHAAVHRPRVGGHVRDGHHRRVVLLEIRFYLKFKINFKQKGFTNTFRKKPGRSIKVVALIQRFTSRLVLDL